MQQRGSDEAPELVALLTRLTEASPLVKLARALNGAPPPLAYTMADLVARTGLSRSTLFELIAKGRGPRRIHIGSRVIVTHRAAIEWLADLEQQSANEQEVRPAANRRRK